MKFKIFIGAKKIFNSLICYFIWIYFFKLSDTNSDWSLFLCYYFCGIKMYFVKWNKRFSHVLLKLSLTKTKIRTTYWFFYCSSFLGRFCLVTSLYLFFWLVDPLFVDWFFSLVWSFFLLIWIGLVSFDMVRLDRYNLVWFSLNSFDRSNFG
jgi:hypothetical protein